jgi:hypothetical protein
MLPPSSGSWKYLQVDADVILKLGPVLSPEMSMSAPKLTLLQNPVNPVDCHLTRHRLNLPTSSGNVSAEGEKQHVRPVKRASHGECLSAVTVLPPPNVAITLDVRTQPC